MEFDAAEDPHRGHPKPKVRLIEEKNEHGGHSYQTTYMERDGNTLKRVRVLLVKLDGEGYVKERTVTTY